MDPKVSQLKEEFKQRIDRLNDYLWSNGLTDPRTRIEQMSFLFFLKMLEEQDIALDKEAQLTKRAYKSIFVGENGTANGDSPRKSGDGELYSIRIPTYILKNGTILIELYNFD